MPVASFLRVEQGFISSDKAALGQGTVLTVNLALVGTTSLVGSSSCASGNCSILGLLPSDGTIQALDYVQATTWIDVVASVAAIFNLSLVIVNFFFPFVYFAPAARVFVCDDVRVERPNSGKLDVAHAGDRESNSHQLAIL